MNIRKKGVKALEVICSIDGALTMGVAVSNKDREQNETTTSLVKSIMALGGYKLVKDQANPRFEYTFDTFLEAYDFLTNHDDLEDVESIRLSRKLFSYQFEPLKIVQRYAFAIQQQDQLMLDLCRQLLDADKFDEVIKLNAPSADKTYREHVVPCVCIHNRIITGKYGSSRDCCFYF